MKANRVPVGVWHDCTIVFDRDWDFILMPGVVGRQRKRKENKRKEKKNDVKKKGG